MAEMTPLQEKAICLVMQMIHDAVSVTERNLPGCLITPETPRLTIAISNLNQAHRWLDALSKEA